MNAPTPGPELRDIHLPPPPAWWPPAPGWWLLALLVVVAAYFATRYLLRRRRERLWRKRVHAELDRIAATHAAQPDPTRASSEVSRLLRRVSLLIEPQAAALRGEAWLDFLDAQWPPSAKQGTRFRDGAGQALIDAPYRPQIDAKATDVGALFDLARAWLTAALPQRRSRV
jgi:hypothetical protein